ncbi:50S ribosomal protein L3 [Candidatus Dojkabacteria bacterium]|nr:50S ribosomal protein L3 [Candidatus Dojkabacteria bacterium]
MLTLLGRKKEMTQVFNEAGDIVPVTIVDFTDNVVIKKGDKIFICLGKRKSANKPQVGMYKELGFVPEKVIEVENSDEFVNLNTGDKFIFGSTDKLKVVDVKGTTKGKGFAGVVKRWGFHGGPKTHGQSDRNRAPGSIGAGTSPGRVFKGVKMAGRLGNKNITVKNLKVIKIDIENNLFLIKGALPGTKNSVLQIIFK